MTTRSRVFRKTKGTRTVGLPVLSCFAVLAGWGAASMAQPPGPPGENFNAVTYVEGLRNPWSMAFLPNGDLLVTERGGTLRIVRDGELLPDPVPGVPAVRAAGQGGLHEVALHPNFDANRLIYLSYAKPNEDGSRGTTALSRGRFENDRLEDVEEIFEAEAWNDRPGHFGGKIAFDADGYLYLSIGDRMEGFLPGGFTDDLEGHASQDTSNHMGTIVRLHDDGRVPEDNPFVGEDGVLPEIWSYGHRNQQGLAFHPETGELWSNEHGPKGGDELNLIRPGVNYGWPVVGYGVNYQTGTPIHQERQREGMEDPVAFWTPSIGISGLAFYEGDAFPNWRGDAFIGGMARNYQQLVRVALDDEHKRVAERQPLLVGAPYRVRDVRVGPDGLVYVALDNIFGAPTPIIRLEPAPDEE